MLTPLDQAHAKMTKDGESRVQYYARLAEAELFLLLESEADETSIEPMIFETSDGNVALVFDTEDRLAAFLDDPMPYVSLPGRRVAQLLAGEDIGLGVNLGVAESAIILPADALDWLSMVLDDPGQVDSGQPAEISPPKGLPEMVVTALDAKLANMAGVAKKAYLVGAGYSDRGARYLLALVGVEDVAKDGVFAALSEALQLSGADETALDITFLALDDPALSRFAKVGLGFDIPELEEVEIEEPVAPGSDPDKPPKLR